MPLFLLADFVLTSCGTKCIWCVQNPLQRLIFLTHSNTRTLPHLKKDTQKKLKQLKKVGEFFCKHIRDHRCSHRKGKDWLTRVCEQNVNNYVYARCKDHFQLNWTWADFCHNKHWLRISFLPFRLHDCDGHRMHLKHLGIKISTLKNLHYFRLISVHISKWKAGNVL